MSTGERLETQLSIGELARCAGVTSRTIRHYHSIGLLPEPARDSSGYRRYGSGDLARLVQIGRLRALGMATDQIDQALDKTDAAGADLPAALLAIADEVDVEIDRLHGVRDRLVSLATSEDLHGAADLLSADLRARGLLDLDDSSWASGSTARHRLDQLLERFCFVTDHEVEALAQELAGILPAPRHPELSVDLPMVDRLIGDRLKPAQRACMVRLRSLLQARSPAVAARTAEAS